MFIDNVFAGKDKEDSDSDSNSKESEHPSSGSSSGSNPCSETAADEAHETQKPDLKSGNLNWGN